MKAEDIHELWETYDDEYNKFELVENKFSKSADLHALILIDKIFPDTATFSGAEHDIIYLRLTLDDMEDHNFTEDQVRELIRCGVHYDANADCLAIWA